MWNSNHIDNLKNKKAQSNIGGGEEKIAKQHGSGKLTARERLEILFDEGTFVEIGSLREARSGSVSKNVVGDGVITGYGLVGGKTVFAFSEDFTVNGGTLGECHSQKICHIMDMAIDARVPLVSINDSGGARIEEGIRSLNGYSGIFLRNTKASGIIPQIAVILGPCAGGACYSPAICDFIFMSENTSQMFITGPTVVKAVTGEQTTVSELGGAKVHSQSSGVAHFVYEDDKNCLEGVRKLLEYIPQNNTEKAPVINTNAVDESEKIEDIVPDNMRHAYDVHNVINTFIDEDSFFEIQSDFAKNIVVGFARLDGETLGVVANQPSVMAGSLDLNASDKAARFVRFCDCFNIPLVALVDVPGYMPGTNQEHSGIIRHGAKLLYAFSEAEVPKISLIMRKAYGGAYIAMNSKGMGADMAFAWPIAQIAVMGAEGAVDILNRKEIKESENPEKLREELIKNYEAKFLNPYIAAADGYIDEVIEPKDTRKMICSALKTLKFKKKAAIVKRHGNIPL